MRTYEQITHTCFIMQIAHTCINTYMYMYVLCVIFSVTLFSPICVSKSQKPYHAVGGRGPALSEGCELTGGASKLGKCHGCTAVDERYTIAQWLAHPVSRRSPV